MDKKKTMDDFSTSISALRKDRRMRGIVDRYGTPDLSRYHGRIPVFDALLRSIIYQQLSGRAAATIHARFLSLFPRKRPTPTLILKMPGSRLRGCGLSAAKVLYIRDVAQKFKDRTIDHRAFSSMSSIEIVEHLQQIKGVGEWTAHMLLIFTLKRRDVLPTGDLAIRKAFQIVYDLKGIPDRAQMERLARSWRDHASIASWYLWRVADEAKHTPIVRPKKLISR